MQLMVFVFCSVMSNAALEPARAEVHSAAVEQEDETDYPFAKRRSLLFKHPVHRDGFHFQVMFGVGGGVPNTDGLHHAMEVGGTFKNGFTLALLHTFVQNKGFIGKDKGPDLMGGWMVELKFPVGFPEFELKFAIGLGGLHDQSNGLRAIPGVGWAYGIDFHLPFFRRSGATVGLTFVHSFVGLDHYFTASVGAGYTFF